MRRGAGWTAGYHLQLTVAAVARPVHSRMVPSSSVLLRVPGRRRPSRRLPGGAASGASSAQASSPWSTLPGRRRGVGHRCPACGVHPAGSCPRSGCPAVWCPAPPVSGHPGSSSGIRRSGRPLSTRPSVQPSAVRPTRPVSSRPLSTRCPDASVCSHLRRRRWDQVQAAGRPVTTATGRGPDGLPRRRAAGSTAEEAWGRAAPPEVVRWSVGCRWRTRAGPGGAGGGDRACRLRDQAGQVGVRSVRGWRPAPGAGGRPRRELAVAAAGLVSSGWVGTTVSGGRGGGPSGRPPARGASGDGVRPQRGPGRQRAFLAGCRQRCDLREWVVGLAGLEPAASS
jgi:hypothetical protein